VLADGQVSIPLRASAQLKVTVTLLLFHPALLGTGDNTVVTVGGVLSRLMTLEAVALLPATSIAVPVMVWFAASVLTVCGEEHKAIPDSKSAQVKLITTSLLFHPLAFGAGVAKALIVGIVSSILTVTSALA
jgi:hypothetical protein